MDGDTDDGKYVTAKGVDVPALGFGTARMDEHDERYRAVSVALEAGYRHLDTAQIYGSESAVGEAVADSDVDRADVWITTKVAGEHETHDEVVESVRDSLEALDTDYVDLMLLHWPVDEADTAERIRALNTVRDEGLVRHIGVSNFSVAQLRAAQQVSDAPVLTDQVEYHVRHRQDDLLAYCIDEEIVLTAYSPLGVGDLLDEEALVETGQRHGKTPAQVAIRWLLEQPMVSTIPMSSSPEHIRENADVFDFELSDDERRALFALEGELDGELSGKIGL